MRKLTERMLMAGLNLILLQSLNLALFLPTSSFAEPGQTILCDDPPDEKIQSYSRICKILFGNGVPFRCPHFDNFLICCSGSPERSAIERQPFSDLGRDVLCCNEIACVPAHYLAD